MDDDSKKSDNKQEMSKEESGVLMKVGERLAMPISPYIPGLGQVVVTKKQEEEGTSDAIGILSREPEIAEVDGAFPVEVNPIPGTNLREVRELAPGEHRGPARANSKEFCDGWERIFGRRSEPGQA